MSQKPVVIVGAGITGLVLAQALIKQSIPVVIYERDPDPLHRGKGWGITIHWALSSLLELLPQRIIGRLPEAYVDGDATRNGENGNFLFFNLVTAEALWQVPPSKRIRMAREKFRRVLMDGIPIKWNHTFESFQAGADGSATANFSTPSGSHTVEGCLIVGCDGSRSRVRSSLFPDPAVHNNYQLPVRLLGASTIYPKELTAPVRKLDPFFFQGGDPKTDAAHWFSFLDSPASSGRGDDSRECQILVSWPYRPGFLGESEPLEIPAKGIERVKAMKRISHNWADPFRTIVQSIPDDTDVKTITLEDWVPPQDNWNAISGSDCVILVGDSAHAMTMYRGEAANHGIADVHLLVSYILPVLTKADTESSEISDACKAYTKGMVERAAPAVLRSRTACLDAHEYKKINDDSPLIQKRVIRTEPAAPLAVEAP
ncbi:FAD binding domain protein [Stachybotrys elegans]|uniref:FAD binding domain protein n=1 Tax=Stachybotrys elegans TaxID=80388 RepID=A0A8K0T212_9HYPO|nr:FAD binding domain protein [Stachybotrys elegans]